ncbi:MAG: fibronectin type III domain-containing protein [Paludibacteraceae bacterium]|nr:fibronectin type III domain-containing protein [Paludibacteraceae bacterium]
MNLKSIIKKSVLASMLAITTAAFGQKDIMLYSTDFTDWTAQVMTGSSDVLNQKGFSYSAKPGVYPTETTGCGDVGFIASQNSTNKLTFPSFTFISGGVVVIECCVNKNGRTLTLSGSGASGVTASVPESPTATKASDEEQVSGAQVKTGKDYGKYVIEYVFSGSGDIQLELATTAKKGEVDISKITVYSSVGSTPYVCSPDYPDAKADGSGTSLGLKLQGEIGGAAVTGNVTIKGYNLTGDVTFSVVGNDAAKFTLGATTMSAADAMAGTNSVAVNFTPSVKAGNAVAMLKISSATNDYYVNLIGATGSGNPQIVAPTSLLNFWTSLIATTTQNLDVSGLNLTGPITATVEGTGASRFSLSTSEISLADATKGTTLGITFTGDIKAGELPASLVLSSPGAPSVTVPLKGVTSLLRPVMYPLTFDVSPSGTAYVETNPGGTIFLEGTQVTVTVTLEKGYKVARWQDASGNTRSTRVFVVSESKNTMSGDPITVFTEKGQQSEGGDDPVEVKGLVALEATNITANSMTANWTAQDGNANGYVVTVTDVNGNVVATQQAASTATSVEISGLDENTLYYYTVEGTGTEGTVTTEKVGGFKTPSTTVKVCGSDDYND